MSELTHHVSRITYHISRITYHASHITYHASRITYHISSIKHQASDMEFLCGVVVSQASLTSAWRASTIHSPSTSACGRRTSVVAWPGHTSCTAQTSSLLKNWVRSHAV